MHKIDVGTMNIYPDPDDLPQEESLAHGLATRPDVRPVFLLADSQLLFWRDGDRLFLETVREQLEAASPKAAYLGASNGDDPEYYAIFQAAMEGIGVTDTRMIPTEPSDDDRTYLEEADLVLLAGGDVEQGWQAFERSGVREIVVRRYYARAVLMGVSAGAVQLGLVGWPAEGPGGMEDLVDTFKLVPYVIDAHAEREEWEHLKRAVRLMGESVQGIGIPSGGGVVYHPDHSIEAVRHPCHEVAVRDGRTVRTLIFPAPHDAEST